MNYTYSFPAIKGVQAGREYFAAMCPLRLIPKIFLYNESELGPEFRAQRTLNKSRVPEMASYIIDNPDYCFSALTASINGPMTFQHLHEHDNLGVLTVPMSAQFIINDGQHRRAAIQEALEKEPRLGSETIVVVFFHDAGLHRSQQIFADLNRNAVNPSPSLGILYDHRDEMANLTREVVFKSEFFRNLVELERTSLATRSRKLFTISALHNANLELLADMDCDNCTTIAALVVEFWETVAKHMPEWQLVFESRMTAGEVRQDFLHSHSLTLQAIARAGSSLVHESPDEWTAGLSALKAINWSRNHPVWEGRAVSGGSVVNSRQNLLLTTNVIKKALGIPLNNVEKLAEQQHLSDSGKANA